MKISSYLLLAAFSFVATLQAQNSNTQQTIEAKIPKWNGYYAGFKGGYNFPFMRSYMGENLDVKYSIQFNQVKEKHTLNFYSMGKGTAISVFGGKQISQRFAVDVQFNYFKSASNEVKEVIHFYYGDAEYTNTFKSTLWSLQPSFAITSPNEKNSPYLKCGIIIAKPSVTENVDYTDYTGGKAQFAYDYFGKFALGGNLTVGCNFKLSPFADVFIESSVNVLQYSPKTKTTTRYVIQNVDSLNLIPTYKKEAVFEEEYTVNYNIDINGNLIRDIDESSPRQLPAINIPFSNFGFNVGVRFKFLKK